MPMKWITPEVVRVKFAEIQEKPIWIEPGKEVNPSNISHSPFNLTIVGKAMLMPRCY